MVKTIYKDLKCGTPHSPDSHYEDFTVRMGLFENFKADLSVSVNRHNQLANAHKEAPVKLTDQFCLSMEYKGYPPHSIFDVDKTALLENKIPKRIYN
jgi:hypothetical protein